MVSVRSATSRRSSLSKSVTGTAGVRSTGSPNSRMGWTATERLPCRRTADEGWRQGWRQGGRQGGRQGCTVYGASVQDDRVHLHPHRRLLAGGADALHLRQCPRQLGAGSAGNPHHRPVRRGGGGVT